MPLTDPERVRVRYHLGYPATPVRAATLIAGLPAFRETSFLIEKAMDNLNDDTCALVREHLAELAKLEEQLKKVACVLPVDQVGNIRMAGAGASSQQGRTGNGTLATDRVDGEVRRWAHRLADTLGVPFYAFSNRSGGHGVSIPVRR